MQNKINSAELNSNLHLGGKWRVSVVDANTGKEKLPFGDELRDNLILDQGKHALAGSSTIGQQFGNFNTTQTCLADLMAGTALIGTSPTPATAGNTGLLGATTFSSTTTTSGYTCTTTNVPQGDGVIFARSWDFAPVSTAIDIWEAAIRANTSSASGIYDFVFTRFVLPGVLSLEPGQFVRLEYILTIRISAIVNAIPISLGSGSFDGTGSLKLFGSFDNIFGRITGAGTVTVTRPNRNPGRGYFPIHRAAANGITYAAASMVANSSNENNPIVFPATNTTPATFLALAKDSVPNNSTRITETSTTAGFARVLEYNPATFTRSCVYTFAAGNPFGNAKVGGIFFNSYTSATTFDYGWLWAFNAVQTKSGFNAISVTFNQTIL